MVSQFQTGKPGGAKVASRPQVTLVYYQNLTLLPIPAWPAFTFLSLNALVPGLILSCTNPC